MPSAVAQKLDALQELAARQDGYFSASQAAIEHVPPDVLRSLERQGFLEREHWGVYRHTHWPMSTRGDLWAAVLWPQVRRDGERPNGVLSHLTALELHGLSDANPSRIDLTLPKKLLRVKRREVPSDIRLHFRDLPVEDIVRVDGLPVTSVYRTLLDLLIDATARQHVAHALDEGPRVGALTASDADRLRPLFQLDPKLLDEVVRERR